MSSSEFYATSPGEKKEDWIPIPPSETDKPEEGAAEDDAVDKFEFVGDDNQGKAGSVESSSVAEAASAADDTVSTAAASKDMTKEINIIQELLPQGVVHQVQVDSSNDETGDDAAAAVQKILQQWSKSVGEPLQKGLDENIQKFRGAVDEHVKPHFDKAKTSVDENVGKHVKPHLEKAQVAVQTLHSQTAKNWEELSSSTRNLMDAHVKPGLENVKKGTTEGLETMKRGSVQGFENSKRVLSDLPGHSKRAMDEHVLPAVETVKLSTQKTVETVKVGIQKTVHRISTTSIESYQKHVRPQVEKAHQVHTAYASCYMGRAPGFFDENETRFELILAEASLRAFGKVLFCDNPVTGGFIWLAMLLGSPIVALCALSSVVSLTYTVKYLELVEPSILKKGDFGVNAVLVGAGSAAFFQFEHPFLGWLGSVLVAAFILPPITLLVYLHCTRSWMFRSTTEAPSIPTLLIPYNVVMVTFLVTAVLWDRSLVVPVAEVEEAVTLHLGKAILNGLTKVFLVEGFVSGLLVLGGTLLCSRILAGSMLVGSVVATFMGWIFGMPAVVLNSGIAGYNAALTTAALAYFFEPSWTLVVVGLFVIILCELFEAAFAVFFWDALGLPITLTFGFCFATIAILMLDTEESCSRAGVLKRVPEEELSTPEEFLMAHAPISDTSDLVLTTEDDEEGRFVAAVDESFFSAAEDTKDDNKIASESTPLLTKDGLDV